MVEKQIRVILYGSSLFVAGIQGSLNAEPGLEIVHVLPEEANERLLREVMEASLLAFFGGATGLVVASLAIFLFRKLIMVSLEIPFLLPSPVSLLIQIGAGLLLALFSVNLAALLPAYKISRQDPAVAMRE